MRSASRLAPGDAVRLLCDDGGECSGIIERFERDTAVVAIEPAAGPRLKPLAAHPRLILAPAIIKGPRMDFLIEKAVELGACEIRPILCARGVVMAPGPSKLARWRRIAAAAAKQSLVPALCQIREAVSFDQMLRGVPEGTLALICVPGATPLGELARYASASSVLIVCGPEGGFEPGEHELALAHGLQPVGLGPNRLRGETAALAALSIVNAATGWSSGPGSR